jgi:hypothetical protein
MFYLLKPTMILLVGALWVSSLAAPVLYEDFANGLPSNWTYLNLEQGAKGIWYVDQGILSHSGTPYPIATPSMNLGSQTSASISITAKSYDFLTGSIQVYYQNEAGGVWTSLTSESTTSSWSSLHVTLPNPSTTYKVAINSDAAYINDITVGTANAPFISNVSFGVDGEVLKSITHPEGTTNGAIEVAVPYSQSLTALTPNITGVFTSFTPTGATNFTNPVLYTLSGTGGPSKYSLTVTHLPKSSAATLTEFQMATYGIDYITDGTITQPTVAGGSGRVDVAMPTSVILEGLKIVGQSISKGATYVTSPSQSDFDCTTPNQPCLTFSVVSEDGNKTQPYDIYVTNRTLNSEALLNAISICYDQTGLTLCNAGKVTQPTVAGAHGSVVFAIPEAISRSSLTTANVNVSDSATVTPTGTLDLTHAVELSVVSENGKNTNVYDLSVVSEPISSLVELTGIYLRDVNGQLAYGFQGGGYSLYSDIIQPESAQDTGIVEMAIPFGFDAVHIKQIIPSGNDGATFVASETPSTNEPFDLTGTKVLYVTATAEDGVTQRIYRVHPNYHTEASSDAGITAASLVQGTASYAIYSKSSPLNSGTFTVATASAPGKLVFDIPRGQDLSTLQYGGIQLSSFEATSAISPSSSLWDFSDNSQEKLITVTAQDKTVREYKVSVAQKSSQSARVQKLTLCDLNSVCGTANYYSNIYVPTNIQDTGVVNVVMGLSANLQYLSISNIQVSPYASFSLNPNQYYWDYSISNNPLVITVTAEDGITKRNFVVKATPEPLSSSSSATSSSSSSSGTTPIIAHDNSQNQSISIQVASGWVEVQFTQATQSKLQLFNVLGHAVGMTQGNGQRVRMNLSHLPNGVYLLKVTSLNGISRTQILQVQHKSGTF